MTDTTYPSQFRQVCALRDGRPVPIREGRADDRKRHIVQLEADVLDLSAQVPATSAKPKA